MHLKRLHFCIKCIMKDNVPVQDRNLRILHMCPKIILRRIRMGTGKRPLVQESSHICYNFYPDLLITPGFRTQSQSISLEQHFYKVIYTLVLLQSTHLLSFAIFHLSFFMLCSLLRKHSSKYFITTSFKLHVLSYTPFVLMHLL